MAKIVYSIPDTKNVTPSTIAKDILATQGFIIIQIPPIRRRIFAKIPSIYSPKLILFSRFIEKKLFTES